MPNNRNVPVICTAGILLIILFVFVSVNIFLKVLYFLNCAAWVVVGQRCFGAEDLQDSGGSSCGKLIVR